jgi:hypothetical protein
MSRLLKTALWTLALLSGMAICTVVARAQTPPIYVLMCPLGHDAYTPRGDTMYHSEITCMDHRDATVWCLPCPTATFHFGHKPSNSAQQNGSLRAQR